MYRNRSSSNLMYHSFYYFCVCTTIWNLKRKHLQFYNLQPISLSVSALTPIEVVSCECTASPCRDRWDLIQVRLMWHSDLCLARCQTIQSHTPSQFSLLTFVPHFVSTTIQFERSTESGSIFKQNKPNSEWLSGKKEQYYFQCHCFMYAIFGVVFPFWPSHSKTNCLRQALYEK